MCPSLRLAFCILEFPVPAPTTSQEIRFSDYVLDLRTGELRRNGAILRLQPQPARILTILASRAGEMVTRQELAQKVWGSETHVDFEHGLNYAIRQIRNVLEDDAEEPRYLETVPKRGYRFIAAVTDATESQRTTQATDSPTTPRHRRSRLVLISIAAATLTMALLVLIRGWPWKQAGNSRIGSLAVLPLRNLSADPEQEYFSDGMTDELITELAKMSGIRIISHTSVERYKKSTALVQEIARELGVDAVVEGTVTRSGSRVRITAQLIDARTDTHLWAESYERDLPDTLALQDTLARDIAQEIGGRVLPKGKTDGNTPGGVSPGAFDSYLRGRYLWNQRNPDAIEKAKGYFEEAIRQAPEFGSAYSGLADCFSVGWGIKVDLPSAEKFARKAISLEPELAEGHASLGITLLGRHRLQEAERELRLATELNPNYAMAHHYYSAYLLRAGRPKDALAESDRARQLDPFGLAVNSLRTYILIDSNELELALAQAGHLAEIAPQSPAPYGFMARVFWLQGRVPEALEAEKKEGVAKHLDLWVHDQEELARVYAHSGLQATRMRAAELMERHKDNLAAAFQYGNAKNAEKAIENLKRAWEEHNGDVDLEIKSAPEFGFMHDDPRFLELMHQFGVDD
jgi:TolB-like protein/DNA-binding winged helix-turn-helix (wHTH) protein/tetratricopeptide (TPR) repeat protein